MLVSAAVPASRASLTPAWPAQFGALSYLIKERLFLGEAPLAVIVGIVLERAGAIPSALGGKPGAAKGSARRVCPGAQPARDWRAGEQEDPGREHGVAAAGGSSCVSPSARSRGIQLPRRYPLVEIRSLAVLLLPVMTCMWLVTTGLTMLCFPEVPLLAALVLASCATPTDPVLSNSIVKGSFADQHVSPRLRNLISAESGINDGFGYPLSISRRPSAPKGQHGRGTPGLGPRDNPLSSRGAAIFGALVGMAPNRVLQWSTNHNFIDKESFLCYGVAVGIFTVGAAGYLNLDDLLAAFAAGNALTWDDWYRKETEEDELQNVIDLLLNTVYFIFVGATIPWSSFQAPETGVTVPRLASLAALVLLLRRLPAMLVFHRFIPSLQKSLSEATFMGYFGPIGAGALFYASLVMDEFDDADEGTEGIQTAVGHIRTLVKPISYALVLSSLLGHTLMIPVLKAFLSRSDIGNIQLMGADGTNDDFDDDHLFYGEGDEERSAKMLMRRVKARALSRRRLVGHRRQRQS
ncbi:hypothetical protein L7F22_029843 [Adiantum nelumboides]|nr:hypothetical protein [Adiantum nelumboides]